MVLYGGFSGVVGVCVVGFRGRNSEATGSALLRAAQKLLAIHVEANARFNLLRPSLIPKYIMRVQSLVFRVQSICITLTESKVTSTYLFAGNTHETGTMHPKP